MLAFDHRGSFREMFGIEAEPTEEQTRRSADAKHLIFEGMLRAVEPGADARRDGRARTSSSGDESPQQAKEHGLKLAIGRGEERSDTFDFEYGGDFGEHIERFDPDFSKVLVPTTDGDADANAEQRGSSSGLADWLHANDRKSSSSCSCRDPPAGWSAASRAL